jgi:hypothetical protein
LKQETSTWRFVKQRTRTSTLPLYCQFVYSHFSLLLVVLFAGFLGEVRPKHGGMCQQTRAYRRQSIGAERGPLASGVLACHWMPLDTIAPPPPPPPGGGGGGG